MHPSKQVQQVQDTWEDEPEDGTEPERNPVIFMEARHIDRDDLRERLRAYRDETLDSPWARDEQDTLTLDFLNWDKWERAL